MKKHESMKMGRKAESIYTAMKRNCINCKKEKAEMAASNSVRGFEEHMRKNAATKACYVYINGISMPVISA